jgi:protocatechuate 3,4-dioxygenase beta subunit
MHFSARVMLILSLLCGAVVCAQAQQQATGTGTITGRVMAGDKPAQGVPVVLMPVNQYSPERKTVARATTDAEGRFRLMNIAAGRYAVLPAAPAFVLASNAIDFMNRGKSVNLEEGEAIDNIDFTMVRGGVVTGRVMDADGQPVVGQNVKLATSAQSNERRGMFSYSSSMFQTDDRGVYRIYGIPQGRYVLSAGEDSSGGMLPVGLRRAGVYTRTFHPGVTDEAKATVVEVTEGSETTNVDITLGRRATTYAVSGTVIDSETGKPVANANTGYGTLMEGDRGMDFTSIGTRTDAEGRFRFEGLLPGRYAAFAQSGEQDENYSVPARFEINDGDVTGLVIKIKRGASLSGVVVIEGTSDRSVLARLSQLRLAYWPESGQMTAPVFGQGAVINPDGSFHITGLPPSKLRLMLSSWPQVKGFSMLRVERDGVEQRAGIIDIPAGTQVSGVRVVVEYGTGIVRGQVRVENGTLPEGTRLYVSARRPASTEPSLLGGEVDARGHFLLEGLPPGEYQLRLAGRLGQSNRPVPPVLQNVSVTNGVETAVTLVIDLNAKEEMDKR